MLIYVNILLIWIQYKYNEFTMNTPSGLVPWGSFGRAWESSHEDPPAEAPPWCGVLWRSLKCHFWIYIQLIPIDSNWFQIFQLHPIAVSHRPFFHLLFHLSLERSWQCVWQPLVIPCSNISSWNSLLDFYLQIIPSAEQICHKLVVEGRNKHK